MRGKEVYISPETKKALGSLALEEDKSLKAFIEAQLLSMGAHGVPYLDLWNENQALKAQLQVLSK